jgi:hypothetical protein
MRRFASAGWKMEQKTLADFRDHTTMKFPKLAKAITVYEGHKDDDLPRTLTLVEASLDLEADGQGKFPYGPNGVTVYCSYSKPMK